MPILINQQFARLGDKAAVPQSDVDGFVAFNTGYTSDYEINLASGNPNAKAVERLSMNWMFNMITDNLLFIQNHGAQQFFNNMPNGYPKRAIVVNNAGTDAAPDWRIFQSVVDNNTNALPANGETAFWQEIQLPAEVRMNIAMPQGGDTANPYFSKGVQGLAIDFNAILTSTTIVIRDDAIAANCQNLPASIGSPKRAGLLEVAAWQNNSGVNVIQRFTTYEGHTFNRQYRSGAWTAWSMLMRLADIQTFAATIATATGTTALTLTMPAGYNWPPVKGAELTVIPASTNTGNVTISIGGNVAPLTSDVFTQLSAGAIAAGQPFKMMWDGINWRMTQALGTPTIGADGVLPEHFVTKRQLDDVISKLLNFNQIFITNTVIFLAADVNPNTQYPGTTWTQLPNDVIIRTSGAGNVAMAQGGADSVTMNQSMLISHAHAVNITSQANGPWNGVTAVNGNHSHSGSTSNNGGHTHGIYANGDHFHDSGWGEAYAQYARYGIYDNTRNNAGSGDSDMDNYKNKTSTNGNHSHEMASAGAHNHSLIINAGGDHQHAFTLPSHNHVVVGNTSPAGNVTPAPIPTLPRYITLNAWRKTS